MTVITLLLLHYCLFSVQAEQNSYSNVTLTAMGGALEAVVYLPTSIKPKEDHFYWSSRFEHGSMIGPITRTTHDPITNKKHKHTFYGTELWKRPHNPGWPESGSGLASEFGVGDDGAFCFYRCGWFGIDDVTNGVLGYREAKAGEPFLKIGVGALIKGSCPSCDSTDDYKFNSPYRFAELPLWHLIQLTQDSVVLEHEAHLTTHNNNNNFPGQPQPQHTATHYGYRLRKDITLHDNVLLVTSTLTNLGSEPFATAWYSHHFFTCDRQEISNGYSARLNMKGDQPGRLYDEPGVIASWATPLRNFAVVRGGKSSIDVDVIRHVGDDVRIKAEFVKDGNTDGSFTLHGCETNIQEEIPQLSNSNDRNPFGDGVSMYAYNLYIEKGTFSPEPQLLIHLNPKQSKSWTQRITLSDNFRTPTSSETASSSTSSSIPNSNPNVAAQLFGASAFSQSANYVSWTRGNVPVMVVFCVLTSLVLLGIQALILRRQRRHNYSQIPDLQEQQQPQQQQLQIRKNSEQEDTTSLVI